MVWQWTNLTVPIADLGISVLHNRLSRHKWRGIGVGVGVFIPFQLVCQARQITPDYARLGSYRCLTELDNSLPTCSIDSQSRTSRFSQRAWRPVHAEKRLESFQCEMEAFLPIGFTTIFDNTTFCNSSDHSALNSHSNSMSSTAYFHDPGPKIWTVKRSYRYLIKFAYICGSGLRISKRSFSSSLPNLSSSNARISLSPLSSLLCSLPFLLFTRSIPHSLAASFTNTRIPRPNRKTTANQMMSWLLVEMAWARVSAGEMDALNNRNSWYESNGGCICRSL